jgi:hypothetical protein
MGSNTRPNNIWHQITHNQVDTVPLATCIRADYFCLPSILERSFRNAHSRILYWVLFMVSESLNSSENSKKYPRGRVLTDAERALRRSKQPFYRDLTRDEQIRVLRAYWGMARGTPEADELRRLKRIEYCKVWGLRGWELWNAVRSFGEVVTSVRDIEPGPGVGLPGRSL